MNSRSELARMANAIRVLAADSVENAGSGHPGMPLGMADVATILFRNHLKFVARDPEWLDRDRFVLSAGHGSIILYALLYLIGSPDMTLEQLKSLRRWGSLTPGHPEYRHTRGVEMTTGPLGQGVSSAVGMAIAERKANSELGDDIIDHHTYVIAGDGCLMEGISHETASLAGHLGLSKLIVLFDDNSITIDGSTDIAQTENIAHRYLSYGWEVATIDGHDFGAIDDAISRAKQSDRPSLICCKTTIGKGAPTKSGTSKIHGSPLGAEEILQFKADIGWSAEPFHIPHEILSKWREVGRANDDILGNWTKALENQGGDIKEQVATFQNASVKPDWSQELFEFKVQSVKIESSDASRVSSQKFLQKIVPNAPWLIGGSADLSGSNGTRTDHHIDIQRGNCGGNYIRYGVREHGMAAVMNGIALHGPYTPYGGTFLVFSDYCRPAIRLSALMEINVIYVMTHDSIGLGADGPTHQPIEHIQSLRLIPNLNVFRPCDAVETAECWALAALSSRTPSILVLSRQSLPLLRIEEPMLGENKVALGAYIISESELAHKVTLYATGSEVGLAVEVQKNLEKTGIGTRVVSVPCQELFWQQSEAYRSDILGPTKLRVSIEAGTVSGWHKWVGEHGLSFGLDHFGASADGTRLFTEFGLTATNITTKIKNKLEG